MDNKFILTDGQKSTSLLHSDDPSVWTFFSGARVTDFDKLYAQVSAVYAVLNAKANIIANMPFVLYKGETEFDNSATWENKVGFLPNPFELLRIDTMSYSVRNAIYNIQTSDAVGYKPRGLYNLVPYSLTPVTDPTGTNVEYIERTVGNVREKYDPQTGKQIGGRNRLIYLWRHDHTTELLPSENTEARAMMNAAGIMFYSDNWVKHFFERGAVAPTVIGMKGAINPTKTDDEERSWTNWLLGLGKFRARIARVFNAETLDVKQFGASVTELKDNVTYEQALRNVATVINAPLSMLFPDANKYGVAKSEEKATWFDVYIIPFCNWLAYEYNRQVFEPLGLRLEFHPETLDPQQEDETERAQAMSAYMKVVNECATYEIFEGLAAMMGLEVPDELRTALQKFYSDKEEKEKQMQEQMQAGGYVVGADGKPVPAQVQTGEDKKPAPGKDDEEEKKPVPPAKFVPSLDQVRELQKWQELCFRKLKRAEPMPLDWRNETLPDVVYHTIAGGLQVATDEQSIKAAFDVAQYAEPEPVKADGGILELAKALNRLADAGLQKLTTEEI